jgi:subtilisin family serine protease
MTVKIGLIDIHIQLHQLNQSCSNIQVLTPDGDNSPQGIKVKDPSHGITTLQAMLSVLPNNAETASNISIICVDILDEKDVLLKVLKAIDVLISNNVQIICLPLGIPVCSNVFNAALNACISNNILVVAAAGNKGINTVLYPANLDAVLSVGALDPSGQLASFSSYTYSDSGQCMKPDVAYLGENVKFSTVTTASYTKSGTSIACAAICSLASTIFANNPTAKISDVKQALIQCCIPNFGSKYGVIDQNKILNPVSLNTTAPAITLADGEPYIDPRLQSQCQQAKRNDLLLSGLIKSSTNGTTTAELLKQMMSSDSKITAFKNFDMVLLSAPTSVYEQIFSDSSFTTCSSTDVNYFNF